MRSSVLVLTCLLLTVGASPVRADTATAQAAQRHEEGKEAFRQWRFEDARVALLQAYTLDPQARYLWDLALAEAKANHPAEALTHFKAYFRAPQATPDERVKAQPLMSDAEGKTGHLLVNAPDGAAITLDGEPRARVAPLPDTLDVMPGPHTVEARFGTRWDVRNVQPAAGETVRVEFKSLEDGGGAGSAVSPKPAPAVVVVPPPAHSPELPSEPPPQRSGPSGARWVVSGVAVGSGIVSLIVGGGFYAAAGNANDEANRLRATVGRCTAPPSTAACSQLRDDVDRHVTDSNVGTALVATGAALVVGGVTTWLLWPAPPEGVSRGRLEPLVGPQFAGARWVQSF